MIFQDFRRWGDLYSLNGSYDPKSKCHLRVVILRRASSARKKRNSIAHNGVPRGSEQINDTCLTHLVLLCMDGQLRKCVTFVRVRREIPKGLPVTHEIACPKRPLWKWHLGLVAPYRAILRYYRCDTPYRAILFKGGEHSPKVCDTPPWYLILHRHICAIPQFATYRAIIVRYPRKTSTKTFCDTIATSIARYEKYRCWASKHLGALVKNFCQDLKMLAHGDLPNSRNPKGPRHIKNTTVILIHYCGGEKIRW